MESILKMEYKYLPNYEVNNMPTIIGEFAINNEMKTPKSCHGVTTVVAT